MFLDVSFQRGMLVHSRLISSGSIKHSWLLPPCRCRGSPEAWQPCLRGLGLGFTRFSPSLRVGRPG